METIGIPSKDPKLWNLFVNTNCRRDLELRLFPATLNHVPGTPSPRKFASPGNRCRVSERLWERFGALGFRVWGSLLSLPKLGDLKLQGFRVIELSKVGGSECATGIVGLCA